jgi:predicted metal-dependent hydrolase
MDLYSRVQLAQPLQPIQATQSESSKPKLTVKSILKRMEHTQLSSISEEPRGHKRAAPDPRELHAEALRSDADHTPALRSDADHTPALRAQLRLLQTQRDDAFQALDAALASASATHKSQQAAIQQQGSKNIEMEHTIEELRRKNRMLEERCVKLSAWAEQHRMATSKLQTELASTDGAKKLDEALSALACLDAKHAALNSAHTTLLVAHDALQSAHKTLRSEHDKLRACGTQGDLQERLSQAEERANAAERSSLSLVCAKKLARSAPMATELLDKASSVLASSTDVLRHVHTRPETPQTLKPGLEQVCGALSAIEAELRGHSAEVAVWLARRAAAIP